MSFEFGMFYEIPVPQPWEATSELAAYERVVREVQFAEEMGFTHFWTVEHHFLSEFSHCSAPEVLYGYVAARTSRIKIGHGVRLLPFPYNHPVRAAEMAATLDLLCGGRLEFGTGRSATREELEGFGIEPRQTRSLWEEALRVIVGAWTNDVFSWRGEHFHIPPRRVLPKPIQRPHPPLWMATSSPEGHTLAGQLGLGLLSFTIGVPPDELAGRIRLYREGLRNAQPIGLTINPRAAAFTIVHCADTNREARRNAEQSVLWYFRKSIRLIAALAEWQDPQHLASYEYARAFGSLDLESVSFDALNEMGAIIVGDPPRCIELLRRYREAGIDQILCLMNPYAISPVHVLRSIELFGRHVIPAFRSTTV
jgi:alkanesulfonate monooxygenase SsuD/methylene tetrahydromethanopterin reductase-like flavin-dependent oxidoreductase (luciferase family)